jgi:hypothetical protein
MNGGKACCAMYRVISRKSNPMYFKAAVIKHVLLPILMYGSEIWGFSKVRANPLQKILSKACRKEMSCGKNICVNSLLRNMGIDHVSVISSVSRCRAMNKWVGLKTHIAGLIYSPPRSKESYVGIRKHKVL